MEIMFHTFQERKVSYTQLLGPSGNILIPPSPSSDAGEIVTRLSLFCEENGGKVFRDKNHFGEFIYLNGLSPEKYGDVIEEWNSK